MLKTRSNNKRGRSTLPIGRDYWRAASRELTNTRSVVISALLTALAIVIEKFNIPIMTPSVQISFSYIAIALNSFLTGPIMAIPSGIITDVVANLGSGYPFYPGYTLSAVLIAVTYALFFYRAKLSFSRIFFARLTVAFGINVFVGSIWRTELYYPNYLFNITMAGIKNAIMLPIEVFILWMFFKAMLPYLSRQGLCESDDKLTATKGQIVMCGLIFLVAAALLILFAVNYNAIKEFLK